MVALYAQTDKIMIGSMIEDISAVGLYSVSTTIINLWSFLPTAIINSFNPVLVEKKKVSNEQYISKLKLLYSIIFWLGIAYTLFILVFGKLIITILYGQKYLAGLTALRIAIFGVTFSFIGVVREFWLVCENKEKYAKWFAIIGVVANIILNIVLIPIMGIAGAASATVAGQCISAVIVGIKGFRKSPPVPVYPRQIADIFRLGFPNMLMQSAYTFYILGLNLILATFSDQAVTALGLYYKWQTFFFIPLFAMQTCIVPVISYNYAAHQLDRCRKTMFTAIWFGIVFMSVGILGFELFPDFLLRVFTSDPLVIEIGTTAFRIIGCSFIPIVTALIFPVFLQAVGEGTKSSMLTVIRTVVCFVPLGFLFSRIGLNWFWLTFPVTEIITTAAGILSYRRFLQNPYRKK